MSVAIAITPASGSVVARKSACRIDVTGASEHDATTYDAAEVPTEDAIRYRLVASKSGEEDLVSHLFVSSPGGKHTWDNVIFPASGTWSVKLVDQRDSSNAATLSVSVIA